MIFKVFIAPIDYMDEFAEKCYSPGWKDEDCKLLGNEFVLVGVHFNQGNRVIMNPKDLLRYRTSK